MGKTDRLGDARGWAWDVAGRRVVVTCGVPDVATAAGRFRGDDGDGETTIRGEVRPYDADQIARLAGTGAIRVGAPTGGGGELWREADGRVWVVDERWGMAELDWVRGHWRAWVLPGAEPAAALRGAVLRPMGQLLRRRGTHLVPTTAVHADGWGVLLLAPFELTAERRRLRRDGFRTLGQWAVVTEADGGAEVRPFADPAHAAVRCDAVLLIEPVRRGAAELAPVFANAAVAAIRAAWPLADLTGRSATPAAALARSAAVYRVRVSRDADEFAALIDLVRPTRPDRGVARQLLAA